MNPFFLDRLLRRGDWNGNLTSRIDKGPSQKTLGH
jgi:hypothetical protein